MQNPGGLRDGTGSIALRSAVCFIHLRLRLHLLLQTLCGLDISSFFSLVWALPRKDFRLRLRHLLMFRPLEPDPSNRAKAKGSAVAAYSRSLNFKWKYLGPQPHVTNCGSIRGRISGCSVPRETIAIASRCPKSIILRISDAV